MVTFILAGVLAVYAGFVVYRKVRNLKNGTGCCGSCPDCCSCKKNS